MDQEPEFQALLDKYGSERAVYQALEEEFERVNRLAFGGLLGTPALLIYPMWLSRGLMGEHSCRGQYEPAEERRPAEIRLFTDALLSGDWPRVLAHEMIHHWEHAAPGDAPTAYPPEIDRAISEGLREREHHWRSKHSGRFIAEACRVALALGVPPRKLLFGS